MEITNPMCYGTLKSNFRRIPQFTGHFDRTLLMMFHTFHAIIKMREKNDGDDNKN